MEVEADCHEGTCYPTIVSFSIDRLPGSLVRINAAHGALTFLDSSQVLERIQIVQIGVWKVEGYGALENRDPSGGLRPIPFGVSGIETGAKGRYRASFPCNVNCIQDVIDNYEVLESFLRSCPKRERPGSLESEDDNWRERIKYWVVEEKAEIIPDSK
ncbi:hypothetical protein [Blastopirellula marina]|uniref:hypothetical protein n=1 Tax=Blastopirellula marina TaxID=124 RepID=UPI0011B0E5A8|nr:hypothetical protein [Blastopirellula marina]